MQYEIRFGINSREYITETIIHKSVEFSEFKTFSLHFFLCFDGFYSLPVIDLISFYVICRLNIFLIDEKSREQTNVYAKYLNIAPCHFATYDESNK